MRADDLPKSGDLARLVLKGRLLQLSDHLVQLTMPDGAQVHLHPRMVESAQSAEDLEVQDVHRAGDSQLYVYADPSSKRPWLRLGPSPRGKSAWWLRDAEVPRPLTLLVRGGEFVGEPAAAGRDPEPDPPAAPAAAAVTPLRPVPGQHLMGRQSIGARHA